MVNLKAYEKMSIDVIRQTHEPLQVISLALQNCMKQKTDYVQLATQDQICYLIDADHMSPLEHVSMTIQVTNMSRSLLAQVTRHRTFKFCSTSQHYQNYSDYPFMVHENAIFNQDLYHTHQDIFTLSLMMYENLLKEGVPKEEARQVLPNAMGVNLLITADARNMINFFRQRLCKRNVAEMQIFANKWYDLAGFWLPEVFSYIGAPCFKTDKCTQGRMKAELCKQRQQLKKEV